MIARCADVAPVEVVIVPGNHDELTAWTVGQVLEAEYAGDKRVTFQAGPKLRKYVHYGRNLIGYTHGCDEPHKNLPQIMAVEQAAIWSQTDYREWHVGHLHKQKATQPIMVDDNIGCTVRIIRALSGTDKWHMRKGYVGGTQGAEAFVWKRTGGLRAHLYHTAA
jgi:DNA repair exonuclease SbcCD nuclease subunit